MVLEKEFTMVKGFHFARFHSNPSKLVTIKLDLLLQKMIAIAFAKWRNFLYKR